MEDGDRGRSETRVEDKNGRNKVREEIRWDRENKGRGYEKCSGRKGKNKKEQDND